MSQIKANGKWLAAMACVVLAAGAAISWGEVKSVRPHADVRDVQGLSAVFRDVSKRVRPGIVTIVTTGKAVRARVPETDMEDGPFGDFFRNRPELKDFFNQRRGTPSVPHGMGSGFVIDPSGVILTNGHVVRDAADVLVRFEDGREVHATDIKADPRTDIAIVRVNTKDTGALEALPMGDSDKMDVGDWVLAVGSPFGLDMTVTAGIVSAKGRGIGKTDREDFLQTDAAINPGNSGGPLLNLNGEVIGINTAISTRSGGYDGVGFAIPINIAHWVSDQLVTKGEVRRAYLGVVIQPVQGTLAKVLDLRSGEGAVVNDVRAQSPAEKAGLKSQDVILDFDGHKVAGPKDLQGIVERLQPSKTYNMTVVRDGKQITVPVTVEAMPKNYSMLAREDREEVPEAEKPKDATAFDELGIEIRELSGETAQELRLGKDVKGVLVSSVKQGSLAEEGGMREGMVIERVNKTRVTTPEEFRAAMKGASLLKGIIFDVKTSRGNQLMAIRKG